VQPRARLQQKSELCPERGEYAQSEAQLSEHYLPVVLKRGLLFPTRDEALASADIDAQIESVFEDKKLGLVAIVKYNDPSISDETVNDVLGNFTPPWEHAS